MGANHHANEAFLSAAIREGVAVETNLVYTAGYGGTGKSTIRGSLMSARAFERKGRLFDPLHGIPVLVKDQAETMIQ
jgi:Asp-tRNA(Asn)/Glu-tRNA(Gln) amidotransferase A subunit family amidase